MRIEVVRWYRQAKGTGYPCLVLEAGRQWEDWPTVRQPDPSQSYETLFDAYYERTVEDRGKPQHLGSVKILQRGRPAPALSGSLGALPEDCCSLGQTVDYYAAIDHLGEVAGGAVLRALRDVTANEDIAQAFEGEPGFHASLLRFSEAARIFALRPRRLHRQPLPPEALRFEFRARLSGFAAPHEIAFEFDPELMRLHRLMAIVGENGTGKTQLLARLAWALWGLQVDEDALIPNRPSIGRVIAVSYSALDDFKRPPHRMRGYEDRPVFDNYCYCGFRAPDESLEPGLLFDTLAEDLSEITRWGRRESWVRMLGELRLLDREPDFAAAVEKDDEAIVAAARCLAAGEKTALSVLTRLLAKLRNRSIVLFDEPETNLHPRLLAALLRVLHDWLDEFDGYGVIATHSPIVLQEIPGRMVRVLTREGRVPLLRPYSAECFGQNLSEIVVEVFSSGERDRNYAAELEKLLSVMPPEAVEPTFGRTLSLGARMALRYLEEYGGDHEDA